MTRVLLTSAAAFALTSVAAATGPGGDVLYDNGLSFLTGLSHQTEGSHHSIIDDFQAGQWSVTGFHLKFAWEDGSTMTGTDLELAFYGDAGGQPDFNNLVHIATNRSYMEMPDPNNPNFFDLTVVDIWVTFDKFILQPGTYWVDMHVVGPVGGFQVIAEFPQSRGAPLWADYEDFGGRQPGIDVFGADYDVNFVVTGKELSSSETICPDDPDDFLKSFGGPVTGDALDLCGSDDVRMEVRQFARVSPLLPFIRLEFWAHSTFAEAPITSVDYTIEGHVSALVSGGQNVNTLQTSIRNYNSGSWELVDQRGTASITDEIITHTQTTDAPDYVNAGDGEVRVKQDVFDPGNVFTPNWFLKVDMYEVTVRQ